MAPPEERHASKAEALREAKAWLRDYADAFGRRPHAHPYFWSAFILLGDAD
ncbi:MAG: CHAT domain-containing protein [bacterium]